MPLIFHVTRQLWILAARARKLLASPRAQRRFNLAGGSLLPAAGVWALAARRVA